MAKSEEYPDKPWKDADLLRELYVGEEMTLQEVGKEIGCSGSNVSKWLKKHGIETRSGGGGPRERNEYPWRDRERLRELYVEQRLNQEEIARRWECSTATISAWLTEHDIERRTISESKTDPYEVPFYTAQRGWEYWRPMDTLVAVHQLLAIAKYGFDEFVGMDVHHKNNIRWDNRPDNIELTKNEDHARKHLKVDGIDRLRVAEFYEHGDIASRPLADLFDISSATVLQIHAEGYS